LVGIVSSYGRRSEFRIPGTDKRFFSSKTVQTGSGALPASSSMGSGFISRGHEVNHSLPSSAEVKNEWSCTTTPLIYLMYLHGVDRDSFTYTYY
jgi:hypothetical protein